MAIKMYVGNFGGPLTTEVFGPDGVTPELPVSASIDIIDMVTGDVIVDDGVCTIGSGLASYTIPSGSPVTAQAGRYVGYMDVLLESNNLQTNEIYLNVYDKTSYLIIERWRGKVVDSAPSEDQITDDKARNWIDDAVDWLNNRMETGYTSVLAAIDPTPSTVFSEFVASVASLMARTAWYANKGSWRDDELSYDARAIRAEWTALDQYFEDLNTSGIFDAIEPTSVSNFNRDDVFFRGLAFLEDNYYRQWHWPWA